MLDDDNPDDDAAHAREVLSLPEMAAFFGVTPSEFRGALSAIFPNASLIRRYRLWELLLAGVEAYRGEEPPRRRRPQITDAQREWILERDGSVCRYCGSKVPWHSRHIDHLIPYSRGGTSADANLVMSCRACNARKGGQFVEEAGMALLPSPFGGDELNAFQQRCTEPSEIAGAIAQMPPTFRRRRPASVDSMRPQPRFKLRQ